MKIATSSRTHWRYEIAAIRCLRTLLRRDMPLTPEQIRFFVERTHHSHPSVVCFIAFFNTQYTNWQLFTALRMSSRPWAKALLTIN